MSLSDRTKIKSTTMTDIAFKSYNSPFTQLNEIKKSQDMSLFLSSPLDSFALALAEMNYKSKIKGNISTGIFGFESNFPKYDFSELNSGFLFKYSEIDKTDIRYKGKTSNSPYDFSRSFGGSEPIKVGSSEDPYGIERSRNKKYGESIDYANLSREDAEEEAEKSDFLEKLENGSDFSISDGSFVNDIKYAAKGMNKFLSKLAKKIRRKTTTKLVVTSALGTKNSPHSKGSAAVSHYNPTNPKIDFGGQLSHEKGRELLACLRETGYFSRCEIEYHGNTCHIDVQVKQSELDKCA